ncbi:hypothetical protein [Desulfovulcanus sp.]
MDLQLAAEKSPILGEEFLTWLWFKSEENNGFFETRDGQGFALYFGQKIVVQAGEGEAMEKAVCSSGVMSELKEARLGLKRGKKVVQAAIWLEQDSNAWQLQIKADNFAISGLKTPKVDMKLEEGDDPDAKFLEKMYLVEKSLEFLDSVYEQFLRLRLSPAWSDEVRKIKKWLEHE